MNRLTIDFLESASDTLVLLTIVNERRAKLNPNAPLAQRLEGIANKLYREEYEKPVITHTPELDAMRDRLSSFRAEGWDEEDLARIALDGTTGYKDTPDAEIRELYTLYFPNGEEA